MAVRAAIASAPPIVDVDHGDATTGPESVTTAGHEASLCRAGRATVDEHHQRRTLTLGKFGVGIRRRVVQPVCHVAAARGERDEFGFRQEGVVEPEVASGAEDLDVTAPDTDHFVADGVGAPDEAERVARPPQRLDHRVGQVESRVVADEQPVTVTIASNVASFGVARAAEHPVRFHDLEGADRLRGQFAGGDIDAVEVPPLVAIGDDGERAVAPPQRLLQRLVTVANQLARAAHRHAIEFGDPQLGRVPRHVRVHPLDPHDRSTIGRDPRRRIEVGPGRDHRGAHRSVGGNGDDLVHGLAVAVAFVDAHEPVTVGGRSTVRVAQCSRRIRFGGQHDRFAARLDPAQALVGEVRVEGDTVGDPPRPTPVLVDARADIRLRGGDVGRDAVTPPNECRPPRVLRPGLGPPHVITVGDHLADPHRPADE